MNKSKPKAPLTDPLRRAIAESGLLMVRLAKEASISRLSLSRFVRGQTSLRLDIADKLAAYFRLELQPTYAKAKGI